MALSRIVYPGDGVTTQFAIPFALGYIKRSDITARVGDEVDGAGEPIYRNMIWISDELVDVQGAPTPTDSRIVFTRTTDRENLLVDYEDGDIINEDNMNIAQKQALMLVHEVLDGRFESFQNDFAMGGFRITNLGAPVDPADAANKAYVDARLVANQSSASQAAASATAAAASESTANSHRAAAASSQTAAANSAAAALASQNASAGSATAASNSASQAATSATTADTRATASANSATASAGSATAAQTARTGAETAAGTATTKASEASASASTASTAATNAGNSENLAYRWANEAVDVEVAPGEYSAYHWAKYAEDAVIGNLNAYQVAFDDTLAGLGAADVQAAIEAVSGKVDNINTVTTSVDGLMLAVDKVKLDGVAVGATANQTDAYLLARSNQTGTQDITSTTTGTLPVARGGTGQTTEAGMRGVYTGTTAANTTFAIGHMLVAYAAKSNVGAVHANHRPVLGTTSAPGDVDNWLSYSIAPSGGSALAGTWRSRGYWPYMSAGYYFVLVERVA